MMNKLNRKICYESVLLGTLSMCTASIAMAAEWFAEPSVELSTEHDDNFRLNADEKSISSVLLHPRLKLSKRTERSEINLTGQIRSVRYNESRFNSDGIILNLASYFKGSERSTLSLGINVSQRPTLTTEVEDSGRFEEVQRDRDLVSINPSWSYQLSNYSTLQISYSGTDVDYNGSSTLIDYQSQGVQGIYSFQQSEKNRISFSVNVSRFEPDNTATSIVDANCNPSILANFGVCVIDFGSRQPFDTESVPAINRTNTVGFNIGASRNFSQTLQGSLGIGLSRSERTLTRDATPFEIANPALTGFAGVINAGVINTVTETTFTIFNASLSKSFELTNVRFSLSNSLNPSSNGVLFESTQVSMNIDRKISPRLDFQGEFRFLDNKTETATASLDRKFYSANLDVIWKFSRLLKLMAGYRYRQQKFGASAGSTDSNLFSISLAYTWPKLTVSR